MERGELSGRVSTGWAGDKDVLEPWMKDNKVRFLAQLAMTKSPEFPNLPLILDYARTPQDKQVMELILAAQHWGRPFVMPPDVPQDRVAAVRKAFIDMTKDEQFLARRRSCAWISTSSPAPRSMICSSVFTPRPRRSSRLLAKRFPRAPADTSGALSEVAAFQRPQPEVHELFIVRLHETEVPVTGDEDDMVVADFRFAKAPRHVDFAFLLDLLAMHPMALVVVADKRQH